MISTSWQQVVSFKSSLLSRYQGVSCGITWLVSRSQAPGFFLSTSGREVARFNLFSHQSSSWNCICNVILLNFYSLFVILRSSSFQLSSCWHFICNHHSPSIVSKGAEATCGYPGCQWTEPSLWYTIKKAILFVSEMRCPFCYLWKISTKRKKMDWGSNNAQETIRAHKERSKNDFVVMLIRL